MYAQAHTEYTHTNTQHTLQTNLIMGHKIELGAEVHFGRHEPEVTYLGRVQTGILHDLLSKSRVLVSDFEHLAPHRVKRLMVQAEFLGESCLYSAELLQSFLALILNGNLALAEGAILISLAANEEEREAVDPFIEFVAQFAQLLNALPSNQLAQCHIHLALKLGDDKDGAPPERSLTTDDIREHVVPYVQELIALDAQEVVQVLEASSLENLAADKRLFRRVKQRIVHVAQSVKTILGVHTEEGQAVILKKLRLAGPDDDEVKVLEPVQVAFRLLRKAIDVVHDDVGVVPERVGHQKYLAARGSVALEHVNDAWLCLDVLPWVQSHFVFDDAVAVAKINCGANIGVHLLVCLFLEVREPVPVIVNKGYQLRVHEGVREGEERVYRRELTGGKVLLRGRAVDFRALRLVHRASAVVGHFHVAVTVQLDDVAELLVDHEAALAGSLKSQRLVSR
jgi:hypothetical protein